MPPDPTIPTPDNSLSITIRSLLSSALARLGHFARAFSSARQKSVLFEMWPHMKRTNSLSLETRRSSIQDRSLGNFADYLEGIKSALQERGQPITVVFGNEAGDLDSMASALSVAYFKHCVALSDKTKEQRVFVPMINIPRTDLRLRPEVIRAFEIAFREDAAEMLQASDLFARIPFRDEVMLDVLAERNDLHIILTDHNRLAPFQSAFGDKVSGIYDHHADEGMYKKSYDRVIDSVGSCCTLAARLWMEEPDLMVTYMPRELSLLLLEAIIVDTASLSSSVTTETDKSAAKFLYQRLGRDRSRDARKEYYKALADEMSSAKKLLRQLKSDELLRRDCKEIEVESVKIAISTISWSIDGSDGWIARDDRGAGLEESAKKIAGEIVRFARKRTLDMVLLLLRKGKGDLYERQIVVCCREKISKLQQQAAVEGTLKRMGQDASVVRVLEYETLDSLFKELEDHADMDLEPLAIPGLGPQTEFTDEEGAKWFFRCYTQLNTEASRKKVVPALQEVITKVAG